MSTKVARSTSVLRLIKTFLFCARKVEIYSIRSENGDRDWYLDIGRYLEPGVYKGGTMTVTNSVIWHGFSYHLFLRKS